MSALVHCALSSVLAALDELGSRPEGLSAEEAEARLRRVGPMLFTFVYVPPVQHMLGQHGMNLFEWLPVATSPWILLAAEESRKAVVRRRLHSAGS